MWTCYSRCLQLQCTDGSMQQMASCRRVWKTYIWSIWNRCERARCVCTSLWSLFHYSLLVNATGQNYVRSTVSYYADACACECVADDMCEPLSQWAPQRTRTHTHTTYTRNTKLIGNTHRPNVHWKWIGTPAICTPMESDYFLFF